MCGNGMPKNTLFSYWGTWEGCIVLNIGQRQQIIFVLEAS